MAVDELTYPRPNPNRAAAGATFTAAGVPVPSPPRTRIVNYLIAVNANTRSSRSHGPFHGPALVKYVYADPAGGAGNDDDFLLLGYSAVEVAESLVALTTPVSWSTFYERMPVLGTDLVAGVRGVLHSEGLTQLTPHSYPVDGVVTLPEWWLVITHGQVGGVAGKSFRGHVLVIEGISAEALANFL